MALKTITATIPAAVKLVSKARRSLPRQLSAATSFRAGRQRARPGAALAWRPSGHALPRRSTFTFALGCIIIRQHKAGRHLPGGQFSYANSLRNKKRRARRRPARFPVAGRTLVAYRAIHHAGSRIVIGRRSRRLQLRRRPLERLGRPAYDAHAGTIPERAGQSLAGSGRTDLPRQDPGLLDQHASRRRQRRSDRH